MATAVISAIPVIAQFTQYIQPDANPAHGAMNSRAYSTKLPVVARCRTSSPRALITKNAAVPHNA